MDIRETRKVVVWVVRWTVAILFITCVLGAAVMTCIRFITWFGRLIGL